MLKEDSKKEIQDIRETCALLTEKNKDYVLAVARALAFAQDNRPTKKQTA